jgi:hypothetical protein
METKTTEQDRYVLIVVDMQPDQKAAKDPAILRAVRREIEDAKRRQLPIIVLELDQDNLDDSGDDDAFSARGEVRIGRTEVERPTTLRPVMELLNGYKHKTVRTKYRRSGAYEVRYACADRRWPITAFRMVGVYAFSCVLYTARELFALNPYTNLEVIQDACGYEPEHGANWYKFDGVATVVPSEPEAA